MKSLGAAIIFGVILSAHAAFAADFAPVSRLESTKFLTVRAPDFFVSPFESFDFNFSGILIRLGNKLLLLRKDLEASSIILSSLNWHGSLSSDSRYLATCEKVCSKGILSVYEINGWNQHACFATQKFPLHLSISCAPSHLAALDHEDYVELIDYQSKESKGQIMLSNQKISSLALSADGRFLAIASMADESFSLQIFNTESLCQEFSFGLDCEVSAITFDKDLIFAITNQHGLRYIYMKLVESENT